MLSVLMAATPCPATIGVPVAFLSGMSLAARHGVLIKSGAALEALAKASHVVLDKTGTITRGAAVVREFVVHGCERGDAGWCEALQLVASVEVLSTHPLATALCSFAEAQGLDFLPAADAEHVYGSGVAASVQARRVTVGRPEFVAERAGVGTSGGGGAGAFLEVHFAAEGGRSGYALLEDPVREGSQGAVARLRGLGLRVSILSGDRSAHLQTVARQVGIDDARGGFLPQEKAEHVRQLASSGCVIMVGDESNDAPALAAAQVGIAVGTSGLASQSADVVISALPSEGALERVAQLVALSRAVVSTARRGVTGGLGLSGLQVAAAATGLIPPRVNAIMQEVVDVTALANAASVLRHRWC